MPGKRYLRRRGGESRSLGDVASGAFESVSRLLVVRSVIGAIRYLTAPIDYRLDTAEPPTGREYERVIEGDDADNPNDTVAEPTIRSDNPLFHTEGSDIVVFYSDHNAVTQQLDVEVWAQTDLHTNIAAITSRRIWVLVGEFPLLTPMKEYSVTTGGRNTFLRVVNSAGISGGSSSTLRATMV